MISLSGCSCGDAACKGPFTEPHPTPTVWTGPVFPFQKEPVVITEIDEWQMEEPDSMLIPWMYNTCSVLSHYCPKTGWRQYTTPDEILNTGCCGACHLNIPDSVLAVWHLYNADEKAKYDKQLADVVKTKASMYVEDTMLWPDSRPIDELRLFEDDDGHIYGANGELLNEETDEWNGTDDVILFSHDDHVLHFGEEEVYSSSMEATYVAS